MKTEVQPDWQRRRSDFNHQWLKNRFLSALDSAANLMQGRIRGISYLQEVLRVELAEWPERGRELDALLADFEVEMSPRKLFETPPLSDWEPSFKEVISELMHELWLVRYPVATWLEGVRKAAAEVNECYALLEGIVPVDREGNVNLEFSVRFEAFRTACRALSKAVEKFPNRILVT